MPTIEIRFSDDHGTAERERLTAALSDTVRDLSAGRSALNIAGDTADAPPCSNPGTLAGPGAGADAANRVRAFLSAMEARDLDAAAGLLAPGFSMQFPGTAPMTRLADLVAWAAPRYRFVRKTYSGFDTVPGDPVVVYCRGTLSGEWPDGAAFDGIRFIDRFEVGAAGIARQEVWNDIAEVRAQAAPAAATRTDAAQ